MGRPKNVIAIGAGLCEGLGYGDNTKSALVTRDWPKLPGWESPWEQRAKRLAACQGGRSVVTCSPHSRNRYVGLCWGRQKPAGDPLLYEMVAEGINSTRAAYQLSMEYGINMPITTEVYNILFRELIPLRRPESHEAGKTVEIEDIAFD